MAREVGVMILRGCDLLVRRVLSEDEELTPRTLLQCHAFQQDLPNQGHPFQGCQAEQVSTHSHLHPTTSPPHLHCTSWTRADHVYVPGPFPNGSD